MNTRGLYQHMPPWTPDEAAAIKALVARVEALPSIAGPTCPVCWPGVRIEHELAATHREWHRLHDVWLMAHATVNRTGLPTDAKALDAARFALADFLSHHPSLTRPSGVW